MVRRFDVCNGDADGLCAVVQWRLHEPGPAELVTGLKRDIALLGRVQGQAGDEVNVFDISMQRNRGDLLRLLDDGARARYFDHQAAGDVLVHPNFEVQFDEKSAACTSLLERRWTKFWRAQPLSAPSRPGPWPIPASRGWRLRARVRAHGYGHSRP
ncbi:MULTISPECIES: hypothetical protein [unclassified Variovorax]|uniref:hypothetical protein n=1 Tax=unclassified Variovorax TaxID=663243 RepID=UPI002AA2AC7A|nr:hypothetical protein [Variovorax sp. Root434]